jgi:cytochrome c556
MRIATMTKTKTALGVLIITATLGVSANAQTPPPAAPAPSPAKQAIDARKAIYTLIGANFRPVGAVLQGKAEYDSAEIQKRATRVAFLAGLLNEAYPDISNVGEPDTKAKADIWTNRADFDKRLKDFQDHVATLVAVSSKEKTAGDAFKTAAGAVAQDCKGCHDNFRAK